VIETRVLLAPKLKGTDIWRDRTKDGQDKAVMRRNSPVEASPDQRRLLDELAAEAVAKATSENFPVALRLLPKGPRASLMHAYHYARFVDDVGDAAAGDRLALLDAVEADVHALASGRPAWLAPVAGMADMVSDGMSTQPLLDLIQANRMDQTVHGYSTFDDLLGYCTYSAAPVGRIVLHIARAATPQNDADSDAVCNALQVLEHCQDVGEDARAGRVYLPGAELRDEDVSMAALRSAMTSPALRRVVGRQVRRARDMLVAGDALVARLRGWPRVAVAGYVAGGRATADALLQADCEVLAAALRPSKTRTLRHALPLLVAR
jgi:squalene synthase HpnC